MLSTVTFFDTETELQTLTGLNHDQLWGAGFNLDDWDFGFVSDTEWNENGWWGGGGPYHQYWLLLHMSNHCVGYRRTEYNGRHYYMQYHA